jgi:hypothetical protein
MYTPHPLAKFLHWKLAYSIHPPNKYCMCHMMSLQVSPKEDMVAPKKKKGMPKSMTQKKEKVSHIK